MSVARVRKTGPQATSHNSISTILPIVLAINGVYTKTTKFHHRHAYRSSRIGPITTTSRLPIALICYECGYNVFLLKG